MQILDASTASHFIERLNQLNPEVKPQWGKMSAPEMIQHCRIAMELPLEKIVLKPNWFFKLLFGKWIKKKVTDDSVYRESSPTASEFLVNNKTLNFSDEKQKLIDTIQQFVTRSDEKLSQAPHQLFGSMTAFDWRRSQWKHLDHHWRQFGI